MRAAEEASHEDGGRHLSGAERLVGESDVDTVAQELMRRARHATAQRNGSESPFPDFVQLTIERVPAGEIATTPPLPVTTVHAPDPGTAKGRAARILRETSITFDAIARAFDGLRYGMGPGGAPPRGAALFDSATGERLDIDPARGVRASRFDYTPETRLALAETLAAQGLTHFRVAEALAVATKVLWSGVRAELCWSDAPEYIAGYVATHEHGYVRFPNFKPAGAVGGRVFFVDEDMDINLLTERLERRALLIDGSINIKEDPA